MMAGRIGRKILTLAGLTGLTLVGLACGGGSESGLSGEEMQQAQEQRLGDWQAHYDEMVSALQLDPDAQASLEAAFLERDRQLRDWLEGPAGRRLIELEAQMAEASRNQNLNAVRTAIAEAKPLREAFRSLIESNETAVLAALTPDQRRAWEGYQLFKRLRDLMEEVNLAPDQVDALRQAAPDFLEEARGAGEPNPSAAAFLQYEQWAERHVLDQLQRGMYADIKRENPLRSLR